jgi:hypothetical protein
VATWREVAQRRQLSKAAKRPATPKGVDKVSARELELFIDNDYQLYRQRTAIDANQERHWNKGEYSYALSTKGYMYLVDAGARKYVKEFGGSVRDMFPKAVRMEVARNYADEFRSDQTIDKNNYGIWNAKTGKKV